MDCTHDITHTHCNEQDVDLGKTARENLRNIWVNQMQDKFDDSGDHTELKKQVQDVLIIDKTGKRGKSAAKAAQARRDRKALGKDCWTWSCMGSCCLVAFP